MHSTNARSNCINKNWFTVKIKAQRKVTHRTIINTWDFYRRLIIFPENKYINLCYLDNGVKLKMPLPNGKTNLYMWQYLTIFLVGQLVDVVEETSFHIWAKKMGPSTQISPSPVWASSLTDCEEQSLKVLSRPSTQLKWAATTVPGQGKD